MPSAITKLLADIKIAHTVFAMPFALLGGVMAGTSDGAIKWDIFAWQLLLIVGCMFFARNVAMLANRIFDRDIDADNPRTKKRAVASGEVSTKTASVFAFINAILFVVLTGFFLIWNNSWPLNLSVPVLLLLVTYPYLKRFTWLCHVYLGAALALSPLAAAIAVEPETLSHAPIWLLSGAVLCWVAGFDIIYALQDIEVDRRDNLKSMPYNQSRNILIQVSVETTKPKNNFFLNCGSISSSNECLVCTFCCTNTH